MSLLRSERRGHVLHLTSGGPGAYNFMTDAWFSELTAALNTAQDDPQVRCVLLSAEGKMFSGGADLTVFNDQPWPQGVMASGLAACMERMETFQKPIVAAVHGAAIGGGSTLLLHCDIVYAEAGTRFQLPFTQIGIVPELGSTWLLPLFAGPRLAADLLLRGEPFDAVTALKAGLITAIMEGEDTFRRAQDTAQRLASLAPAAMRATKGLLKASQRESFSAAWRAECAALERCFAGGEAQEAREAFFAKRRPDFSRFS